MSTTTPHVTVTLDDITEVVRQYKAALVANVLRAHPRAGFSEAKLGAMPLVELQNVAALARVDTSLAVNAAQPTAEVKPMQRVTYNWNGQAGGVSR